MDTVAAAHGIVSVEITWAVSVGQARMGAALAVAPQGKGNPD